MRIGRPLFSFSHYRQFRYVFLVGVLAVAANCASPCRAEPDPKDTVYQIDGVADLQKFEGRTVRTITIEIEDVFEDPVKNSLYKTVNQAKINTQKSVIQRELLFKEGDQFSAFRIKETERVLRQLRYIREPHIETKPTGDVVDIVVRVQDTWTLIPTFNYSSGSGSNSRSAGVSESNLLGAGKRLEALVAQDKNRQTFQGVYDDWRVMDSDLRAVLADFYRADGNRFVGVIGSPFRTLLDNQSWSVDGDISDNVSKLWKNGTERFIYREKVLDLGAKYSISAGPRESQQRYSVGFDYQDYGFALPTAQDFQDANVDPAHVSTNPALLAADRRYIGPSFTFESLHPRFISRNYIDRFDRAEDYDLGSNFTASTTLAGTAFGSTENAALVNLNQSGGRKFDQSSFIRGELGFSGRYTDQGFENTLFRAESKYYNVLGDLYMRDIFLGMHTLAFGASLDYGNKLDKDREFLLGADSGLRGYDAYTFTGDKRVIINLEDRVHLADDVFEIMSVGAAAFVDVGGSTYNSMSTLLSNDLYGDAGVGLRLAFPRSSGGRTLRIDFAVPFRDGSDGSNAYEIRMIFAGGQIFSSKTRSELLGTEKANVEVGSDR